MEFEPQRYAQLKNYSCLIEKYTSGSISVDAFEEKYLSTFKTDPIIWDGEAERILEDLFFALEDYCPDPRLRDPGELDEAGLLEAAKKALGGLRNLGVS